MPNITYKSCYYLFILDYPKKVVIFTCRYFKLSWNTTALSQSNYRNFSCSSIRSKRVKRLAWTLGLHTPESMQLKETTKFQAIVQKQTKVEITAHACIHTGFHCLTEIDQIFHNNYHNIIFNKKKTFWVENWKMVRTKVFFYYFQFLGITQAMRFSAGKSLAIV